MSREIFNANVAVIGGAGFLGSHLVNYLIEERYCRVTVFDNLVSGQRKHVHPDAEFVWFNICGEEHELSDLLIARGIRYVFNYAAEPYIPECYEHPMHFFEINAVAVLKVLNACQRANVEGLLQVSSAEIYGDASGHIREDHPVIPHSTYGVSKVAADGLVQVRWREARVPAIALRQFNCVGERETHEYVIPEIISQIHNNGPVVKLGNNSVRDFLYAGDAVRMAVELLEKGQFGEVYNMGSQDVISIYELAQKIGKVMGFEKVEIREDETRKRRWEIWHLCSCNEKLYRTITTRPKVGLDAALKRTVDYFHNNGHRWDW